MNYGEMLDQVRRAGGMDVDTGLAGIWINERHKRLAIESEWTKRTFVIGTTVAGQSQYDLPEALAEIDELKVGSTPYTRVGVQSLWDLQGDLTGITGVGGVYAPGYSDSGAIDKVEIHPTPEASEAGEVITAVASAIPDDLGGPSDTPEVPADFHQAVCEGAMADAFAYVDENIPAADRYEARFDLAVEKLRRRRNRKVGGGPHFVQIENVHYRR